MIDELNQLGIEDENTNTMNTMNTMNTTNTMNTMTVSNEFPSSSDPTDEQVKRECSDIVVNDITIPVDVPGESNTQTTSDPVIEIKYDNVDLVGPKGEVIDQDRFKRLVTNMEVKEAVNVIKSDEIAKPINDVSLLSQGSELSKPSFSLNNLYPNMNTTITDNTTPNTTITDNNTATDMVPLQIITENNPVIINEPKSPRKEIVLVKNEDDIDETSSLAHFFDDMKTIVEEKGIKVERTDDKTFSLFEDASEVEK